MLIVKHMTLFLLLLLHFASTPQITHRQLLPPTVVPGDVYAISLSFNHKIQSITIDAFQKKNILFSDDRVTWHAYLGVPLDTSPGRHTITVTIHTAAALPEKTATINIQIIKKRFPLEYLSVSKKLHNIITAQELPANMLALHTAQLILTSELFASDGFIVPAHGEISTDFGFRRMHKVGTHISSTVSHIGMDISSKPDTPIYACGNGKVVFARRLIRSGNTIVINHGQGIFSKYLHMNKLLVQEGQHVTKGQRIGRMGSTGFSTGSHVHWQIEIQKIPVNPMALVNKSF